MRPLLLLCVLALGGCLAVDPTVVASHLPPDPAGDTAACREAKAEGEAFEDRTGERVVGTAVRGVLIGPMSASANQANDPQRMERALVSEKIIAACTTLPAFERAAPVAGQPWPHRVGYLREYAALVRLNARPVEIFVHPTVNTLMIKPEKREYAAQVWPKAFWPAVAASFIAPAGCRVTEERPLPPGWEVAYVCPAGVDLPRMVRRQHSALMRYEPLRP